MINDSKLYMLGRNIAAERKAKNYSQNELAEKLSVSREHLAKIETGKKGASLSLIFLVADVLGVPESVLFDFSASSEKQ